MADDIEEAVFRARAQIEDDGSQDDAEVLLHAGHVRSMLNEIERLRVALKPLAGIADCVDRAGSMRLSDETGLWTQGNNMVGDYRLTLGHARRAKELVGND